VAPFGLEQKTMVLRPSRSEAAADQSTISLARGWGQVLLIGQVRMPSSV
jgi:hypothetical protein